jgi:hypothetical protein
VARRGRLEPDVDLVLAPTLGYEELPPAGVDELGVRLPFSALHARLQLSGLARDRDGNAAARRPRRCGRHRAALALEREGGVR